MRQTWWPMLGALVLAGCVTTTEERVHDYNEDGVYLYQKGDYAGARDSFQAALKLQPEDPNVLYNVGECYDRLGDATRAEKFYNECLQRVPNHVACRHSLDLLLVRQNRQPEARKMVDDWLTREPKLAAAYAEDGWLWQQIGDLPRAQARLHQALELEPHDERTLTELAALYEIMQRPDRALVLYERILERDPNRVEIVKRVNLLMAQGAGRPHPE